MIRKTIDPAFKFSEGASTTRTLGKFIGAMEVAFGAVTPERLVDVCVFAVYRVKNVGWNVKTAFSPKVVGSFQTSLNGHKYYEDVWLKEHGLTRLSLVNMIADRREHPLAKYISPLSEEHTKLRNIGQRAGYIVCQVSTLGWAPSSKACGQCPFTSECKVETNRKYPELYRLRTQHGN